MAARHSTASSSQTNPDLPPLLQQLTGGDRRSIGQSEAVVAQVLADPSLFATLFTGMSVADPLIRMRASDAVEKITIEHPDWVQPYTTQLLTSVAPIPQQEVRWHVAEIIPRLDLTPTEQRQAITILRSYLDDKSGIVKTFAMQALADLALHDLAVRNDPTLRDEILPLLEHLTQTGTPAMHTRGRKLLPKLTGTK